MTVQARQRVSTIAGSRQPLPSTVIEEITPRRAEHYLTRNLHNRRVTQNQVDRLAKAMLAGEWKLTHQGIAFDTNDVLLDGQQRLMAIIQSGQTVYMMVTRDLPPDTFPQMDIGIKRTAAHVLAMEGYSNTALLAGAVKVVISYRDYCRGEFLTLGGAFSTRKMSNQETIDAVLALDGIEEMAVLSGRVSKLTSLASPSAITGALYQCALADDRVTTRFIDGILSGESLEQGDPRLTLRNRTASAYVMKNPIRKSGGGATQAHSFQMILGAWRAFKLRKPWTKAQAPTSQIIVGPIDNPLK